MGIKDLLNLIFSFCLLLSFNARAQDEKFLKENILKRDTKKSTIFEDKIHWEVEKKIYNLDLDNDGFSEKITVSKKDFYDCFNIYNLSNKVVHSSCLLPAGKDSVIYKVQIKNISSNIRTILLHYYEGYLTGPTSTGTGRLYFINVENNELSEAKLFKGPIIWEEKDLGSLHYHNRNYKVHLQDFNTDGILDIGIYYHKINDVYVYDSKKGWRRV